MADRLRKLTYLCVLAALSMAVLASAGVARASNNQESIFQDDTLLLNASDAKRQSALDEIKSLGADTVHVLAIWQHYAPSSSSKNKPKSFDGTNPAAYPAHAFDALDALILEANARGLGVLLTPGVPAPVWGTHCKSSKTNCRPDAGEFRKFVTALGTRYSGSFVAAKSAALNLPVISPASSALPRVSRWSALNEPNLGGWLTPQYTGSKKHPVSASPLIYRRLFYAMADGLSASGHGSDQMLLGETAPIGHSGGSLTTRNTPPLSFYRTLFCLDSHGKALKGSAAAKVGCKGPYRKLSASGIATHPYTQGADRGPTAKGGKNDLTLAQIKNLEKLLNVAAKRGRIGSGLPILFTEYGVQTHPPDSFAPSTKTQAVWLNQAEWLGFRDSRIRAYAQFELIDPSDPNVFNTGLRFSNGHAKPSLAAYRLPIWVVRSGKHAVNVFGAVRPAGASENVDIQRRSSSKGKWTSVASATVGAGHRYLLVHVTKSGGHWRLVWKTGGKTYSSREASVSPR